MISPKTLIMIVTIIQLVVGLIKEVSDIVEKTREEEDQKKE